MTRQPSAASRKYPGIRAPLLFRELPPSTMPLHDPLLLFRGQLLPPAVPLPDLVALLGGHRPPPFEAPGGKGFPLGAIRRDRFRGFLSRGTRKNVRKSGSGQREKDPEREQENRKCDRSHETASVASRK